MSENLVIVSTIEDVKQRYGIKSNELCLPIISPSILSGGDQAWVITSKNPRTLQSMNFGFTSHRSKTRTDLLNLRTDDFEKEDDDMEYDRLMNIFINRQLIQSLNAFRCVVMVDAFLVTSPDNRIYLIHMQNHERPFAIAGIYDHWKDQLTDKFLTGFTIITAESNPMLKRIGIDHMPAILTKNKVFDWLDLNKRMAQILPFLHTFPDETMNGYPVSSHIYSGQTTGQILNPIGQKLKPDQVKLPK
ncbi:MAG: hypothetical protein C0397_19385 [Odoribacter sp.]|nr:hypothetical protein [Odoribacter sp.]